MRTISIQTTRRAKGRSASFKKYNYKKRKSKEQLTTGGKESITVDTSLPRVSHYGRNGRSEKESNKENTGRN